jgi:predicted phosphodiesterase
MSRGNDREMETGDNMKVLLVTDTHGKLDVLNDLAAENSADAIIHAGDFGFYDEGSVGRLSERELKLRIVHSDLSRSDKENVLSKSNHDQREFVHAHLPLSDLPHFLSGESRFETPIYAVWGNHEDVEVVKRFYDGRYMVDGLHVLHDQASFHLEGLHIFGLGGNFLVGKKLFHEPIAGGGGRIWSVLGQYIRLLETVRANTQAGEKRILVSHVSPGKEAFVTLMGIHAACDLIVSGHMGPPFSMMWNDFAIRDPEEAESRVRQRLSDVERAYEALDFKDKDCYIDAISHLANLPDDRILRGRGQNVPAWYLNMFNVNLSDMSNGYALLETDGDTWKVDARCVSLNRRLG